MAARRYISPSIRKKAVPEVDLAAALDAVLAAGAELVRVLVVARVLVLVVEQAQVHPAQEPVLGLGPEQEEVQERAAAEARAQPVWVVAAAGMLPAAVLPFQVWT